MILLYLHTIRQCNGMMQPRRELDALMHLQSRRLHQTPAALTQQCLLALMIDMNSRTSRCDQRWVISNVQQNAISALSFLRLVSPWLYASHGLITPALRRYTVNRRSFSTTSHNGARPYVCFDTFPASLFTDPVVASNARFACPATVRLYQRTLRCGCLFAAPKRRILH
jgi:hypothetical protein